MPDGIIKTVDSSIFNVGLDAKALLVDLIVLLFCIVKPMKQYNKIS